MFEHHAQTIQRLVERFSVLSGYLGLVIVGSVARGEVAEDGDVDVVQIATEEEMAKQQQAHNTVWWSSEYCTYPHGYVDAKIVDIPFLRELAERGSEPARSWFSSAIVAYAHSPEIGELLAKILTYPEQERLGKIRSFYALLEAFRWYMGEADKRDDAYLRSVSATKIVLAAGRMVLAYNRILYPFHKRLLPAVQQAPEKPEQFLELANCLLTTPCLEHSERFCEHLLAFRTWEAPPEGWGNRYVADVEWTWREGKPALEDW